MPLDIDKFLYSKRKYDESQTKQFAILPILRELGWDIFNPDEVWPEYRCGSYKFDYALCNKATAKVIVEAKRLGTDLTAHKKQLLRYSFEDGADLAVLTDGKVWWVYLPRAESAWEKRFVSSYTITSSESIYRLRDLLSKDAVLSGKAVKTAIEARNLRDERSKVKHALPKVLSEIPSSPDIMSILTNFVSSKLNVNSSSASTELTAFFGSVNTIISTDSGKLKAAPPAQLESVNVSVLGKTFDLHERSVSALISAILLSIAVLLPGEYTRNRKLHAVLNRYYKKGKIVSKDAVKDWKVTSFKSIKNDSVMLVHIPKVRYSADTLQKLLRELEELSPEE